MTLPRCSAPSRFSPRLIAALHTGDKAAISAEMAISGIGAGIVPYHGIRADGCCTCGDFNCPDAGKHPDRRFARQGVRSATRDPSIAWQVFNLHPDRNLALVLGQDLAAVDLDPRHGADLTASYGPPLTTMTARSGGGGLHRLYRLHRGSHLKGGTVSPGVDLRTGNQAIVIEKSRHRTGGIYEWVRLAAPIAILPVDVADARGMGVSVRPNGIVVPAAHPFDLELGSPVSPEELESIWRDLLRDNDRERARLLLEGRWKAAGYPSQSEAEYGLVLRLSRITDDQRLWVAVLRASGLGQRDRARRRDNHGRGGKLARRNYIEALVAKVTAHRTSLRATGDPNLELAQRVFGARPARPVSTRALDDTPPTERGSVQDPKKNPRGRPCGGGKRQAARVALIGFLADPLAIVDHNGYIRLPVGASAAAAGCSLETVRLAVHDLLDAGIVEGLPPKAYVRRGQFARDRYLRLMMPLQEARERVEEAGHGR